MLDGSATSMLDTVRRLGFLQIDPISTVAPPQYLVLWSRLGPYEREELDRWWGGVSRGLSLADRPAPESSGADNGLIGDSGG